MAQSVVQHRPLRWALGLILLALSWSVAAQESETESPEHATEARTLVIEGPIDEGVVGRIRNAALKLQESAANDGQKAFLILECRNSESEAKHVLDLADFLSSSAIADVTTIAWVPENVTGMDALLPLVCRETVMHPDAELGDLGSGGVFSTSDWQSVLRLVARGANVRVNAALVAGMADPSEVLLAVTVDAAETETRRRVVTEKDLVRMRTADVAVSDLQTLKEAGLPGLFSGTQLADVGVVVSHLAIDRNELAELYRLPIESLREDQTSSDGVRAIVIRVDGEVGPLMQSHVERQIERAVDGGFNTIIFEVDSPGGMLWHSEQMARSIAGLSDYDVRTIAYIPQEAISGAAIISFGCDEIYLHPSADIGDAGPIEIGEGGQFQRAPEKVLSYLRGLMEELAEMKGRPTAVLMAMADKDLQVYQAVNKETGQIWYMTEAEIEQESDKWKKGPLVPGSEDHLLLTVNGEDAHSLKIAEPPVVDFDDLKSRIGIPQDTVVPRAERTGMDDAIVILNSGFVTGLLFFLGVLFLFVELHFVSGLFGILSAVCFSVFFWSKFLGGTAGWLEVVLFLIGFVCLALEIFVIPGFGVFGVAGGLLILGALVMASVSMSSIDQESNVTQTWDAVKSLSLAIVAVIGVAATISRFLPHIPYLNSIILAPPAQVVEPSNLQQPVGPRSDLIGQQGTALTVLRPAGKIRVNGELIDAVSAGGFIDPDATVEVSEVSGNKIVVRQVS